MTTQERIVEPAMDSPSPSSPYLSLRQAVRPAIFAHFLLAEDQERARQLAAECEDLLFLTRELLKAAGLAGILGAGSLSTGSLSTGSLSTGSLSTGSLSTGSLSTGSIGAGSLGPGSLSAGSLSAGPGSGQLDGDGGDRQAQLLGAYAEAGLLWAKVVGSTMALARALLDRGDWDGVRRLAGFLADAGEDGAAAELKIQLGRVVWGSYREQLQGISSTMPPAAIGPAIDALRAVLLEVPDDVPDRNREVNRFLAPLAGSVLAIMRDQGIDIPYSSRVEHIATGGVARYPDIVKLSLDEIAAEFEGTCNRPGALFKTGLRVQAFWACASGPGASSSTGPASTGLQARTSGRCTGYGESRSGNLDDASIAEGERRWRDSNRSGPLNNATF
jgi:hypothetical protein